MDALQLWEEFRDRLCENYMHWGVPVERAYLESLAHNHFVLCWHGFTLSNFILPEQGVFVRPEVDAKQNFLLTLFLFSFFYFLICMWYTTILLL